MLKDPREQFMNYVDRHVSDDVDVLPTGWPQIDDRLAYRGLPIDSLLFIFGRSGVGKTYFVTNWINRILPLGKKVVFFSFEMSYRAIVDRFLRLVLRVGLNEVSGYIRHDTDMVVDQLERTGFLSQVHIVDESLDLAGIDNVVAQTDADLYIVDHLHLIRHPSSDIFTKTTELCDGLAYIKKRYQTRFAVLTQLKRLEKDSEGIKPPLLTDGKGGGGIEQSADAILGIWRPDASPLCDPDKRGQIFGYFLKNRMDSGVIGTMKWRYDRISTRIMTTEEECECQRD